LPDISDFHQDPGDGKSMEGTSKKTSKGVFRFFKAKSRNSEKPVTILSLDEAALTALASPQSWAAFVQAPENY
jgi:hypothetical protein